MASSGDLKEASESLDVGPGDVRDLKRAASMQKLAHPVKLALPILAFILGLWVGRMAFSQVPAQDGYPFLGAAGIQTVTRTRGHLTWTATIILSVVLYTLGFVLYKLMVQDSFGVVTLYGPHSRQMASRFRLTTS